MDNNKPNYIAKKQKVEHSEKTEVKEDVKQQQQTTAKSKLHSLQDDVMVVIFSYLKCREVVKASITCKEWNRIYNSELIQMNEQFAFEIRWAKYAGGYLQPKKVYELDGNFLWVSILNDGKRMMVSRGVTSFDSDRNITDRKYFIELYQIDGDSICKTASVDGSLFDSMYYLKDSFIVQQVDTDIVHCYFISNNSKFQKMSTIELSKAGLDVEISYVYAMSQENKVYILSPIGVHVWDPCYSKVDDDDSTDDDDKSKNLSLLVETSSPFIDFCCWGNYLILANEKSIQFWSAETNSHLKTVAWPHTDEDEDTNEKKIDVEISVKKIKDKHRLVACYSFGTSGDMRFMLSIFSLESFSCLHVNENMEFPRLAFSRNGHYLLTGANTEANLKIWKANCIFREKEEEITFSLLETINDLNRELWGGFDILEFLHDGRLFTANFSSEITESSINDVSFTIQIW